MTSSPYNVFVVFCFVLSFVKGNDRHMICKEVHDVFADRSPSTGTRMIERGMPGKAGPRGPAGLKGEPGIVEPELLRNRIAEEVNRAVQERFARYDANFEELNSKLQQMEKKLNETGESPTAIPEENDEEVQDNCETRSGVVYDGKCYWLILHSRLDVKFGEAEKLCSEAMGQPADILNQVHYDMIEVMARRRITSSYLRFWTGMKINPTTKAMTKYDGSSHSFAVWYEGYPVSSANNDWILLQFHRNVASGEGMANVSPTVDAHGVLCQQ